MEFVLIDIGIFQDYILDNIRNLKLFGNNNITVITETYFFKKFENVIIFDFGYGFFNENFSNSLKRKKNKFYISHYKHISIVQLQ